MIWQAWGNGCYNSWSLLGPIETACVFVLFHVFQSSTASGHSCISMTLEGNKTYHLRQCNWSGLTSGFHLLLLPQNLNCSVTWVRSGTIQWLSRHLLASQPGEFPILLPYGHSHIVFTFWWCYLKLIFDAVSAHLNPLPEACIQNGSHHQDYKVFVGTC